MTPNPQTDRDPPNRLGTALRLSLEFRASGRHDVDAFLDEHAELRELIEPMLRADDRPPEPVADRERLAPGTTIGGYELESVLGRGGMGTVFRARQPRLGRHVAIKVLSIPLALVQERALWRFQREARLLATLDHPGIVKVFDAGVEAGVPYYVMELIAGAPLNSVLAAVRRAGLAGATCATVRAAVAGSLAELDDAVPSTRSPGSYVAAIAEIGAQVAEALACAHAAGVIHRDVKPGNVLLCADGRAMLADFGVAHHDGAAALTVTGDFAGTPSYMSPEQASGRAADHRSDLFSLGVLLYEALTLQLPFAGNDTLAVLDSLRRDDPREPAQWNRSIPADLSAVVLKAMAKEPERRYQAAGELAADLRAFLAGQPVSARHPTRWQRLHRWARREPWRAAALGIGAAGLLALGALSISFTNSLLLESARTRAALDDFNRLALGVRLEQAQHSAAAFRIARADAIPRMQQWLQQVGEPLAAELPRLRELLAEVRGRALPYDEEAAAADRESHPEAARLAKLQVEAQRLEAMAPRTSDAAVSVQIRERLEALAREHDPLRDRIAARRTWLFPDPQTSFLHDQIAALVVRLEQFAESERGTLAHVRAQLAWAAASQQRCFVDGSAAWAEASAAIAADPRYAGLRLRPQTDLLPVGPDPKSGLWEFVHLRSGAAGRETPPRRADGTFEPNGDMGILFVLLPGGRFRMGAQPTDPDAPNYDPDAGPHEAPVHEVELAPFFLAKYELTQAQWRRLTGGEEPSYYRTAVLLAFPPQITDHNPLENVPHGRMRDVLEDHGLRLPTEAQWEYACRAGRSTPLGFDDRTQADRYGNLADASPIKVAAPWPCDPELDDGHVVHAPVGSYLPNDFGLHDMHGNVSEATADLAIEYGRPVRAGDGLREQWLADGGSFMQRGGAFSQALVRQRASDRSLSQTADYRADNVGVRPARAIEP